MGSSSDSDVGERMRNLRHVLVKAEDSHKEADKKYAYKQKLGDLIFSADYEAGNLGHVERVNLFDYDVMVRSDVANPRHRLWFNFTVSNQLTNQCVIFNFVNFSDNLKLFNEGLTPVVRSRQNPNWWRLHRNQVFYYESLIHGKRFVLSIAFRFSSCDNEHQFALFYPYSYTNLLNFTSRWTVELKRSKRTKFDLENRTRFGRCTSRTPELNNRHKYHTEINHRSKSSCGLSQTDLDWLNALKYFSFDVDPVGTTVLSKFVYQLSVKILEHPPKKKSIVITLCRPCGNLDSVASFVCQGMIDYILSDTSIARMARHFSDYIFFPMLDPDSISTGNSRSDIFGQSSHTLKLLDSNKGIYENFLKIKQRVEEICGSGRRVLILELGVNHSLIGSRLIGTHYEDEHRMERHLLLPRLLSRFSEDFYLESCEFKGNFEDGVSFPFGQISSPLVDHYLMEISSFAFYKRSLRERNYIEYNQKEYLSLGKALIFSLLELLRYKDDALPYCTDRILEAFHKGPDDVDDLILNISTTLKDI